MRRFAPIARLLIAVLLPAGAVLWATSSPAHAACSALPATAGTVTVSNVSVPAAGNYRVWARIIAPATTSSAVYMQVDNTFCNLSLGGGSVTAGALTWIDYQNGDTASKVTLTGLTSGAHVVTLAGKDAGLSVDKLLFLTDTACTPSGDGSNCQASGTPSPTTSPSGTPAPTPTPILIPPTPPATPPVVSGDINLDAPGNLSDKKYFVDGTEQDSSLVDTTKLSDGLHTVTVEGIDSNGLTVKNSETIRVKNHFTALDRLVAFTRHNTLWLLSLAVLIALGVTIWFMRRSPYVAPYLKPILAKLNLSHINEGMPHHGPVAPPPADVVFPDHKTPPETK